MASHSMIGLLVSSSNALRCHVNVTSTPLNDNGRVVVDQDLVASSQGSVALGSSQSGPSRSTMTRTGSTHHVKSADEVSLSVDHS